MIAVMSGSFLQRGEPAIMDKFHRTKAALSSGVDIVLELPYIYAVQNSDLFAQGAVQTLHEIGVSSLCFGSESGDISRFTSSYNVLQQEQPAYQTVLQKNLNLGLSFPEASRHAYQQIGLATSEMDLTKPNNILGFSYVKAILDHNLSIKPLTITRIKSAYHDQAITGSIASATSIRKDLLSKGHISETAVDALPDVTIQQLHTYKKQAGIWHSWEDYFQLIHYRVMTMTKEELAAIHGVDEGLENRIKKTARSATSFYEWINKIKTKRYTWTRLQRIFAHILTSTAKADLQPFINAKTVPYVRLLGMTKTGQSYLNDRKKDMDVPLISTLAGTKNPLLSIEEKASHAYYSIIPGEKKQTLHHQELKPPIII
ncbi:UPF0348 protein YlbM [Lentibacillus kapialis]|uniref:tRNA(Met) cytidine acetate ligase n=1 Tax=Lentibacillus kapialis TaxID=340214 RepID=A0A917UUT0_9BACI|nr:UPF0348 protein YlbM [Lentibacillus kapialis]